MKTKSFFKKTAAILLIMLLAVSMASGCTGASGRSGKNQETTPASVTADKEPQTNATSDKEQGKIPPSEETQAEKETKKTSKTTESEEETEGREITEDGEYSSKEDVAEYLHLFGHLPDNYITKNEAKELGWVSSEGNLWDVAPGKSIGGDRFGNREGLLPDKKNRKYFECDIDFDGGYRDSKRIIYSNDGLVYYTEDHYNTFELLYGEE